MLWPCRGRRRGMLNDSISAEGPEKRWCCGRIRSTCRRARRVPRTQGELSPAEREGLLGWCGDWRHDFNADARACGILVDALARFRSTWDAFGTFLRDSGMLDGGGGELR